MWSLSGSDKAESWSSVGTSSEQCHIYILGYSVQRNTCFTNERLHRCSTNSGLYSNIQMHCFFQRYLFYASSKKCVEDLHITWYLLKHYCVYKNDSGCWSPGIYRILLTPEQIKNKFLGNVLQVLIHALVFLCMRAIVVKLCYIEINRCCLLRTVII